MSASYDVFVSHNGREKPSIERLCVALEAAGLRPWFDEWALAPGDEWFKEVERMLDELPVVLVCVGVHGFEPWQDAQRQVALERAISGGKSTVVPVLLPGAPEGLALPGFLRGRTPLDLRDPAQWERGIGKLGGVVDKRRRAPPGPSMHAPDAGTQQEPAPSSTAGVGDDALVDELARVLWDPDQARLVARSAGFPAPSMPTFRTPQTFWARVVEDARNGMVRGGVAALASAAARSYPGNVVFTRYRGG